MPYAYFACHRRPGRSRCLWRIQLGTAPYVQRSYLLLQFWNELRVQRRNLRRRRGELLALVREPHDLLRGVSRFVQPAPETPRAPRHVRPLDSERRKLPIGVRAAAAPSGPPRDGDSSAGVGATLIYLLGTRSFDHRGDGATADARGLQEGGPFRCHQRPRGPDLLKSARWATLCARSRGPASL